MSTKTSDPPLPKLAGRVIGPDDPDYDKARTSFYGGFDLRPGAIVRVANTEDVSRGISFARETGTQFVVRSGGHGGWGDGVPGGGVGPGLGGMPGLPVGPPSGTARGAGGVS